MLYFFAVSWQCWVSVAIFVPGVALWIMPPKHISTASMAFWVEWLPVPAIVDWPVSTQ